MKMLEKNKTAWPRVKLRDISHRITKGTTPTTIGGRFVVEGINFLKVESIDEFGRIDTSKLAFIDERSHELLKRSQLEEGDVLFSIAGAIGRNTIIQKDYLPANTNQALAIIRLDKSKALPQYIFYALRTPYFQGQAYGKIVQCAQANVNLTQLSESEILLPSFKKQEAITSILEAYDDLIQNNLRRIELLEESARLLYREWFLDFRFPGHEHTKIIKGVPEGWQKVNLEDILDELEAGNRPKGGATDEGIPSIGAENIIGIGKYDYIKDKFIPEEFFEKMNRGVIKNRDVLLYKDGANIGRVSYFGDGFPHLKCAVNEHVFILRTNKKCSQNFLYFWLDRPEANQMVKNLNASTAQPGVNQEKLRGLGLVIPSHNILTIFEEYAEPIVKQIFNLAIQNKKLRDIRDILLPRLMNGDVAV